MTSKSNPHGNCPRQGKILCFWQRHSQIIFYRSLGLHLMVLVMLLCILEHFSSGKCAFHVGSSPLVNWQQTLLTANNNVSRFSTSLSLKALRRVVIVLPQCEDKSHHTSKTKKHISV